MFELKSATKKLKDICSQLGPNYSITVIDLEQVIYRKINDMYDIEISGLNNNRKTFNSNVYVWRLVPSKRIEETIQNLKSIEQLKDALNTICQKYSKIHPGV